jgi:hypothetical protein
LQYPVFWNNQAVTTPLPSQEINPKTGKGKNDLFEQ